MSLLQQQQGIYSLNGKTFHRKISLSLETARLDVIMIASLWNLTGTSAALVSRRLGISHLDVRLLNE